MEHAQRQVANEGTITGASSIGVVTLSPDPVPRRRLLVVEDHDETRHWCTEMLINAGYQVDQASDGREALAKASQRRYNGVLLDLVLPTMDGWQFRETALRHPELARIPTIVLTVRQLREPERYALQTPFVLQKPLQPAAILAMVTRAFGGPVDPTGEVVALTPGGLLWSKRGEIACAEHAPAAQSTRWNDERWQPIPPSAPKHGITYQCQHCAAGQGPISHASRRRRRWFGAT